MGLSELLQIPYGENQDIKYKMNVRSSAQAQHQSALNFQSQLNAWMDLLTKAFPIHSV